MKWFEFRAGEVPEASIRESAGSGLWTWAGLLFLLGSGCSEPEGKVLRIGINPWPGYEYASLAEVKGFYRAEGVRVRIVEFSSLSDSRRAYERGQIDGFFGTLVEAILTKAEGKRAPKIVMVTDASSGADVILARSDVATVAQLKGKRVAVEFGSLSGYLLARALELNQMTLGDVTLINTPLEQMFRRFSEGSVDAAVTYPPVSLEIAATQRANVLFSSAEIPGEVVDVLILDDRILRSQPEAAKAVSRAFFAARKYAEAHREESFGLMAQRIHLSPREFAGVLESGIELVDSGGQLSYFGAGGKLRGILAKIVRQLQETEQLGAAVSSDELLREGTW